MKNFRTNISKAKHVLASRKLCVVVCAHSFSEAIFPYIKRVIVLLILLSTFRDYVAIAQSPVHTSKELMYILFYLLIGLFLFTFGIPIIFYFNKKLKIYLQKIFKSEYIDSQQFSRHDLEVLVKFLTFLMSIIISGLLLLSFAPSFFTICLAFIVTSIFIIFYVVRKVTVFRIVKKRFILFDVMSYLGFSVYVLICCLIIFVFDEILTLELSSIFLVILLPRVLLRHQLNALKTLW